MRRNAKAAPQVARRELGWLQLGYLAVKVSSAPWGFGARARITALFGMPASPSWNQSRYGAPIATLGLAPMQ